MARAPGGGRKWGTPVRVGPPGRGEPEAPPATRNLVLRGLKSRSLAALMPQMERVRVRVGDLLHEANRPIGHVYYPLDAVASIIADAAMRRPGEMGVSANVAAGRVIEVSSVTSSSFLGMTLLLGGEQAPFHAIGQSVGQMLRLPTREFRRAVGRSADFRALHQRAGISLLFQMGRNSVCNASHSLTQRCARWVLLAADGTGGDFVGLTHLVLSQMLASHRPAVTAVLGELSRRGVVQLRRGGVLIMDRAALEAAACPCYFAIREEERRRVPVGGGG